MSEIKCEIYDKLETLGEDIRARKRELNTKLSNTDKEITDIKHYIEFYPLSASKGYQVAKLLKDCLIKRREIKNELEILERIQVMSVGHIGNGKGRDDLDKMLEKHYQPRVLKELFNQ